MDDRQQKKKAPAAAAALSPSAMPRRTGLFSDETKVAEEDRDRRLKRAISKARSKRKLFPTDDDGRTVNLDANIVHFRGENPAQAERKSSPRRNIKTHARGEAQKHSSSNSSKSIPSTISFRSTCTRASSKKSRSISSYKNSKSKRRRRKRKTVRPDYHSSQAEIISRAQDDSPATAQEKKTEEEAHMPRVGRYVKAFGRRLWYGPDGDEDLNDIDLCDVCRILWLNQEKPMFREENDVRSDMELLDVIPSNNDEIEADFDKPPVVQPVTEGDFSGSDNVNVNVKKEEEDAEVKFDGESPIKEDASTYTEKSSRPAKREAKARVDLSSTSLRSLGSTRTTDGLFEPFPAIDANRSHGRARPNMFVDWMRLSKMKVTVLSNPRLMVNDLKTEQKY